ncbi:response regulator transcription factor [Rhizobacter sp. SG703]|uniref:response regulator n=1 Tax=Rhizobacter sp. SG703 TaxID=2587140 RepID=UPI001446DA75|nr:response regulator transcription factor [Rhizobacter sp. SG703]NKI92323.1 two-component system OmpR family response regulator [Rhizobacter sp. SG703]
MRVLLVEDDRMIGAAVQQALSDAAYAVDWTTDGEQALAAALAQAYDVVLLDLGLPLRDGIDVLRQLRARNAHVPILIVTARDEVEDRIAGLDLGADDYVLKPFDVQELLARMRAVMRRQGGSASPLLTNGTVTLDPVTRDVSFEGHAVTLSGREFTLLQALLVRPGAILSRQELEERIYGWNEEIESNTVEVLIHGIRRKLGPTVIRNVRGVGWRVDRGG